MSKDSMNTEEKTKQVIEAIKAVKSGAGIDELALKYYLDPETIKSWCRKVGVKWIVKNRRASIDWEQVNNSIK